MTQVIEPDFHHLDRYAQDPGDEAHTPNKVFNLCFVPKPGDETAQRYSFDIERASRTLDYNGFFRTCYTLTHESPAASVIESRTHATLSHVVFEDPAHNLESVDGLAGPLAVFVGNTEVSLPVVGLTYFRGRPFDRLLKATGGKIGRLDEDVSDCVVWASINLTQELRQLRHLIGNLVEAGSNGKAVCIGAQGDAMLPHHTAYVRRVTAQREGSLPSIPWDLAPEPQSVPHVLALGTCGPWGQVTEFTTEPTQVRDFLKKNILKLTDSPPR